MSKLIPIVELAKITGLSVVSIRKRVAAGTIPYTRANTNTKSGKLLFNAELVQEVLRQEVISNLKGCSMDSETEEPTPENTSYLASLFKPSADPWEADAEKDLNFGYTPRNTVPKGSFTK